MTEDEQTRSYEQPHEQPYQATSQETYEETYADRYGTVDDPAHAGVEDPRGGRHPLHVAHLVMGIAFLGLAGVWAGVAAGTVGGEDVRWLLPVPWVLAGLAGLLAVGFGGRRVSRP